MVLGPSQTTRTRDLSRYVCIPLRSLLELYFPVFRFFQFVVCVELPVELSIGLLQALWNSSTHRRSGTRWKCYWLGGRGSGVGVGGIICQFFILWHFSNHRFCSKTGPYQWWGAVEQCLSVEFRQAFFFVFKNLQFSRFPPTLTYMYKIHINIHFVSQIRIFV